jgi:hypothetical protein
MQHDCLILRIRLSKERSQNVGDALWLADIVSRQMAEAVRFDGPGIGYDPGKGIQCQG